MSENNSNNESNWICKIADNYKSLEASIVEQLHFSVEHGSMIGTFRESIWKDLFRQIVPKKFQIEQSVFIVDSDGRISKEVDLVVFDEQYTPYIFNYGNLRFIPIEAVAVVIQCKSYSIDIQSLTEWLKSINELETSRDSITRQYSNITIGEDLRRKLGKNAKITEGTKNSTKPSTQTSTKPISILCHLGSSINMEKLGFDIEMRADNESKTLIINFCKTKDGSCNLNEWYKKLNHHKTQEDEIIDGGELNKLTLENYEVKQGEYSLLSFIFQLNQLLMLINNPLFFPHLAYVKMFENILSK